MYKVSHIYCVRWHSVMLFLCSGGWHVDGYTAVCWTRARGWWTDSRSVSRHLRILFTGNQPTWNTEKIRQMAYHENAPAQRHDDDSRMNCKILFGIMEFHGDMVICCKQGWLKGVFNTSAILFQALTRNWNPCFFCKLSFAHLGIFFW